MKKYTGSEHVVHHPRYQDAAKDNGHRLPLTFELRRKILQHKCQMIEGSHGVSLLDAGCGNGLIFDTVIRPVVKKIDFSMGVDFVPEVVESARPIFDSIGCGDVLSLDRIIDRKFDIVNSTEVFLYIQPSDRVLFFRQHIDAVCSGGYFLLTLPNLDSIYRKLIKPSPIYFPYHFNQSTVEEVAALTPNIELISASGIDVLGNIYNLNSKIKNLLSFELGFLFKKIA
jgi:predicted TPR repeat methyltransferase